MKTTKARKRKRAAAVVLKRLVRPLMVFTNLNVAAFDRAGKQIPELQKSLASLLAEHIEGCGYDPEGVVIETNFGGWFRLFKTRFGEWNHELV